jgi:hypothetical protein
MRVVIKVASETHFCFAQNICDEIDSSAKVRGTGIAKRKPEYILQKMKEGKAIIATIDHLFAGFCYIESWEEKKYIVNSGLIIKPSYRGFGLAKKIKEEAFKLSRKLYPNSKLFGLTTSGAVMKINSSLGYEPVNFSELTKDESFWKGCSSCVNYDILNRTNKQHCLCTGMLMDPNPTEAIEKLTEKKLLKNA